MGPDVLLAISVASLAVGTRLLAGIDFGEVGLVFFLVGLVAAVWGVVRGAATLMEGASVPFAIVAAAAFLGNLAMLGLGMLWALFTTIGFSRGRQLRRFGRVLLPPVGEGGAWATSIVEAGGGGASGRAIAKQWRENGRTEHASVAAFARLTLDLMALGAPPRLVAAANRDALDEIRHAELCFSLARAIDGVNEGPGPFPQASRARTLPRSRTLALSKLAVDSLVDGALHEGVSARVIARLARRCEDPAIRAVLRELAADEGRHAAHGWDAVAWCLEEGGRPVAHALRGAARALPERMQSPPTGDAADGSWERWGIAGGALEGDEYGTARAQLVRRVEAMTTLPRGVAA